MSDETPEAREAANKQWPTSFTGRAEVLAATIKLIESSCLAYAERVTAELREQIANWEKRYNIAISVDAKTEQDLRAKLADAERERVRAYDGMMDAIEKRTEFARLLHAAIARAEAGYAECAVVRDDWEGQAFKMQNERDALRREVETLKANNNPPQ